MSTTPTETDRLTTFIARRLAKRADLGDGRPVLAIAETAQRFNDSSWFWADDNAKMAELFCAPHVRDKHVELADATIDFVLRMSRGTVIRRRCGPPEVEVVNPDPRAFQVRTAFFSFGGDLSVGVVRHSARFNDGRSQDVVQHTGNLVKLTYRGRPYTVDIENAITEYGIIPGDGVVTLFHSSPISVPAGLFRRERVVVGTVRYEYVISAHRSAITLRVLFQPQDGRPVRDLVLTTGYDKCGDMIEFRSMTVGSVGGYRMVDPLGGRGLKHHKGAASYLGIVHGGDSPGFSYAVHNLLRNGDKLTEVVTTCHVPNRLHWLTARYAVDGSAPVMVEEERLLTAGGYYDDPAHYAEILRLPTDDGQDPSMTYDIGAELNAVATCYLFGSTGRYAVDPPSPARLAELRAWFDRHLDRYFSYARPGEDGEGSRIFCRGLAFVVLSLDCMVRATGNAEYRARMDTALAMLLRRFDRIPSGTTAFEGAFIDSWTGRTPFLDLHASGLLALARCARYGDPDGEYGRLLSEAVRGVKVSSVTWEVGPGLVLTFDTLCVRARRPEGVAAHEDPAYWCFKLGLLLRALDAVQRAQDDGLVQLQPDMARRVPFLIGLARQFLQAYLRDHGDTLEILTGQLSGETNSETQPWVTLGLDTTLDRAIEAMPVPNA